MRNGAHPLSFRLTISAPMERRGVMIRFIGRDWMEASPFNSLVKDCPARIPEISRVVVPLFPTSRTPDGVLSPWSPLP